MVDPPPEPRLPFELHPTGPWFPFAIGFGQTDIVFSPIDQLAHVLAQKLTVVRP